MSTISFRGKSVTVSDQPNNKKRVAIWMPGEENRTRPLLEELFTSEDFYEASKAAMIHANQTPIFYGGPLGPTAAFMVWWAEKNYRDILAAEDQRERGNTAYFHDKGDFDPTAPISTREFIGEDGRRYVEKLDIRGDETDPILLKALKQKRDEERQIELRRKIALARREAEQAELEAMPEYGSF